MDKNCALFKTSNLIGKKWTLLLVLELYKGDGKWKRYNAIKSKLPQLTPKMLSTRLKELEHEGIIMKRVDSSVIPIKSEYSLSKRGEELIEILKALKSWSIKYGDNRASCKNKDCRDCEF